LGRAIHAWSKPGGFPRHPRHWGPTQIEIRICYVYFKEAAVILLVVAYAKNEADDIPASDKKYFRELIKRENAIFSKRTVR
jgi:hypothetical protein